MRYYHEEYGRPVGLAEVSVANGCENDCMELGLLTGTYDYLTAVGGWNTAQNTIGVVLAQLVIASYYNGFCGRPEQLRRSEEFMASRLASDWLYQSNVLHRYLVETAGHGRPLCARAALRGCGGIFQAWAASASGREVYGRDTRPPSHCGHAAIPVGRNLLHPAACPAGRSAPRRRY